MSEFDSFGLSWRLLAEGALEVHSNFLLGYRGNTDPRLPSHKICCYMKLLQADHGRGGILYIYPRKSCLGHYIVFSFFNITVKEPWVAASDALIELILDFEPVQFIAMDSESRDSWLSAFRSLEKVQQDHAIGNLAASTSANKSPRVSADELVGTDIAVHHGEHMHLQSPHKDIRESSWSKEIRDACSSDTKDATLVVASPLACGTTRRLSGHNCIILNNRHKWDSAESRSPLVVICDLVHIIQSLYGVTKEGQRIESSGECEEDEWHAVADTEMFNHFVMSASELQTVNIDLLEPQDKSKFFVSAYSLLSMHAAGALKVTLQEVLEKYTSKVAYIIANDVYSLGDIVDMCS